MIVVLIVLAALVIAIERWSVVNALKGVVIDYKPSIHLAAPDEAFELISDLSNRSRRFVPFIRAQEYLPPDMALSPPSAKIILDHKGAAYHSFTTYLMPRSALRRSVEASISKRGRYMFTSAVLKGGDFLGLSENSLSVSLFSEIVIYPGECFDARVRDVMGGFLGDMSVRRFIIEDPVLTAGFREYSGREPMKNISWFQTFDWFGFNCFQHLLINFDASIITNFKYTTMKSSLFDSVFDIPRNTHQQTIFTV